MFFVLLILACISFVLYLEIKAYQIKQKIKHTPGLQTLPLIGNAHQLGKTPSGKYYYFFLFFIK